MPTAKKALTQQLVAVLETHLDDEATRLAPAVIAKVLHKLAKQVLQQPGKGLAGKSTGAPSTAKHARKVLAAKLTSEVQVHLGGTEQPASAPTKALTKTIKHLANQVVKQQRKQPTLGEEPTRPVAPAPKPAAALPTAAPTSVSPAKPAPATRRPPVKRTAKAAASTPAVAAAPAALDSDQ